MTRGTNEDRESALHLVIIGGGFSGASLAIHLMRHPAHLPIRLTLVDPQVCLGAGIAYSAADPLHRVNIAAAKMSLLADEPDSFDDWVRSQNVVAGDPEALCPDGTIFPARARYGHYVDDLLRATQAKAAHIDFRHVQTRAEAVTQTAQGYRIALASGEELTADILVLATGHAAPRLPAPLNRLPAHPKIIANAWAKDALAGITSEAKGLIVGTGLTMGDMVASLRARGIAGEILAVSRRGLVPRERSRKVAAIETLKFPLGQNVSATLHAIRVAVRQAAQEGRPWYDVFDAVRHQNTALWRAWSKAEKQRFQRHLRPYWDVHRFQAAPQIHNLVIAEQAKGGLRIEAASLANATIAGDRIEIGLKPRGSGKIEQRLFDYVVNCTGASGHALAENPVLVSLASQGLLRADALGSGIDIDDVSRARNTAGALSEDLFVIGPAVRPVLGEVSGAPELSSHVELVTAEIARLVQERAGEALPPTARKAALS
jgi:uncharacterized NAD(P)/FAD-binding protein YdhS